MSHEFTKFAEKELTIYKDHNKTSMNVDNVLKVLINYVNTNSAQILSLPTEQIGLCKRLLKFKPLTPLMNTKDEWEFLYDGITPNGTYRLTYQNRRYSSVFKNVYKNGIEIAYDVDQMKYSDDGGVTHYSTSKYGITQIRFPYMPEDAPNITYRYKHIEEENSDKFYILTDPTTIQQLKNLNKNASKK